MALLKCSKVLDTLKVEGDQKVGVDIVRRAVETPMRWIATNAGVEGSIVVQKVRDNKDANYGYNEADRIHAIAGSTAGRTPPVMTPDLLAGGQITPERSLRPFPEGGAEFISLRRRSGT